MKLGRTITLICNLLLILSVQSDGQVSCGSKKKTNNLGDYPPGCRSCSPSFSASNRGYTPDTLDYEFNCGEVENSFWFSIFTNSDSSFNLDIVVSTCEKGNGLEMAIYDQSLNLVKSCNTFLDGEVSSIFVDDLEKFTEYYVMVDGIDGDICNFEFAHDLPFPELGSGIFRSFDEGQYCVGSDFWFSVPMFDPNYEYEWVVPQDDSIVFETLDATPQINIHFKTTGKKVMTFKAKTPCNSNLIYTDTFEIVGERKLVDTFFLDNNYPFCVGGEKTLSLKMDSEPSNLNWWLSDAFELIDGGGPQDTFVRIRILEGFRFQYIGVDSDDDCGIEFIQPFSITNAPRNYLRIITCVDSCYQYRDSCYTEEGLHTINIDLPDDRGGCDSIVSLDLEFRDVFASPTIFCDLTLDSIFLNWVLNTEVDSFRVFVNRQRITTTTASSIILENELRDTTVFIKIQPIGACTYLPAEITCELPTTTTTSLNENYLDQLLNIFPNPTEGKINIETDLKIEGIEFFSAAGQLLQKDQTKTIDLDPSISGICILKIRTEEGVVVKRVLVR